MLDSILACLQMRKLCINPGAIMNFTMTPGSYVGLVFTQMHAAKLSITANDAAAGSAADPYIVPERYSKLA